MLLARYPRRSVVAMALMISQAFFYNAIFFTYALVLTRFHGVAEGKVGALHLAVRARQRAGAAVLGPLFDSVGRRRMIALTYVLSGVAWR